MTEEDITNLDPENIAQILFTKEPGPEKSIGIFVDDSDAVYIFEVLITIYMEGMMILFNNLNNVDLNLMSIEHLIALRPWFKCLGFILNIDMFSSDNMDDVSEFFCDTKLKDNDYKLFFELKGINKNYHFLGNALHPLDSHQDKDLKDIYTILKRGDSIYKIWFTPM